MKSIFWTIVLTTIFLQAFLSADDINTTEEKNIALKISWMNNLLSGIPNKERNAAMEASEERKQIIVILSSIVKEPSNEDNRAKMSSAIRIAGIMRLSELVNVLVDKIDFLEYGALTATRPFSSKDDYIVVGALIQIGKPSILPVIKRLTKETEERVSLLCIFVIHEIEGGEFTKAILQKAIQKAEGKEKENLEKALENALKLMGKAK